MYKPHTSIWILLLEFMTLFILLWPFYLMNGLGAGDCKLLLMTGIYEQPERMVYILFFSFLLGAVWGLGKHFLQQTGFNSKIHFAPFILFGTLLTIL